MAGKQNQNGNKPQGSTGRTKMSDEEFVSAIKEVLDADGTKKDLADKTGLAETTISSRMTTLRKLFQEKGLTFPSFRRPKKEIDIEGLNKILQGK